ncbi:MAG: heme ABC exporter ATP-binding protein CcmA [Alphaproteobacteria bacterium]|nr:heme ABC exporter ATP-binding protein CcmA [Alphaproteobacteria bacterium]
MIQSLTAEKLTVQRGSRRLVENLSFTVKAGQALSLEGANGAGKTSLLRLIAGLLPAGAGSVTLHEGDTEISEPEERGKYVGWLGHHDALKASFTVSEQLAFFSKLYGREGDEIALLGQVGLSRQAELPCRYLSAGQRRRLALARLLASRRPLWLLDEPFAALDTVGKALVARLIALHCGEGGLVIAATHESLGLSNETLRLGNAVLKL